MFREHRPALRNCMAVRSSRFKQQAMRSREQTLGWLGE